MRKKLLRSRSGFEKPESREEAIMQNILGASNVLEPSEYSGEVMRSDGTITRSDGTTETFTAPQIPTINGTTVIDVDTAVKPESMTIKYKAV